jgi:hypothetical protein
VASARPQESEVAQRQLAGSWSPDAVARRLLSALAMMRLTGLISIVVALGGCLYWDTSQPKVCGVAAPNPASGTVASNNYLLDPSTLTCAQYGSTCDPDCGGCVGQPPTPPIPSWGSCYSGCQGLDQPTCEATASCRPTFNATYYFNPPGPGGGSAVADPYNGCYPTDTVQVTGGSCLGLDAYACSQHADCAAIYEVPACKTAPCPDVFVACEPETAPPGGCVFLTQPRCNIAPPTCPSGYLPTVANGCWAGGCIPTSLCPVP